MDTERLMLSKTYRPESEGADWSDTKPSVKKRKIRQQRPSKKELLDDLMEQNDGYIITQVDDLARDE
jgi:hypothetical protein